MFEEIGGLPANSTHAFHIHELGHAHWAAKNENRWPVAQAPDVEDWRTAPKTQPARRDVP